ncbi:MAG TPA: hypothetical protein VK463_05175 [Desulfomonilaceae bacterium]|nr:hypothetical protein [Desulfomonilaceae bacterium]
MENRILLLGDGTVLAECGPMRMFIGGSVRGVQQQEICAEAAEKAVAFFEEIAANRDSIRAPFSALCEPPRQLLTHVMWEAVARVGDDDLTPMAAVAGTLADAVADFLTTRGLTKIVVNNGGDVALRLKDNETATVGIRPDVNQPTVTHRITVSPEMHVGGICTSGLGGRSFTRGIASAATILASSAAIADAAASSVANATLIVSPAVRRNRADYFDPNTDLTGVEITTAVGELTPSEIDRAIMQGIRKAEELVGRKVIRGACVAVKGRMECTRGIALLVGPRSDNAK